MECDNAKQGAVVAPEVETNDFTGFLDPENVGLTTEITFLSALVSKL